MSLCHGGSILPVPSSLATWALLVCPSHRKMTTKVGVQDDSIACDCKWTPWLDKVRPFLADGPADSCCWNFTYPDFCRQFRLALKELRMEKQQIVPYQARHSGAAIDQARRLRPLAETKKRGRWASDKSVVRYERHARLGHSARLLTPTQRVTVDFAELHFGELVLGQMHARRLPMP